MPTKLRQYRALLLPLLMVVVLPYWLLSANSAGNTRWERGTLIQWIAGFAGFLLFAAGMALFSWCIRLFASLGQGTLSPWDPTHNLVASGPYCYVRNPMISAVVMMIAGETLFWGSAQLSAYLVIFVLVNHLNFVLVEEPGLEKRFGEPYRLYKANVPRWLPRRRPWQGK
jgi:protein-S-isoprenylcysteine O-methyltransferase Ste14